MYSLKKPYELPENIQASNCMYQIKPINSLNVVKSEIIVNGNMDTRYGVEATLVNGAEDLSQSTKKNKLVRTNSNSKSPEIAKEFGTKGKENQLELKKESGGSPTNVSMKTNTHVDEDRSEKVIANLETRQNEAIKKLTHSRDMHNNVNGATWTATRGKVEGQLTESVEAIVHADPANVPLSIFFLANSLRESYGPGNVNLKKYWHSSCQDRTTVQNCYASMLSLPAEETSGGTGNMIDISIIWKKVPDGEAQLLVQSKLQAPIRGEANVARYLSRLLPGGHPLNYDALNWDDVIRVDQLLENAMDGLDFAQLERQLEAHNPCLIGKLTIADFVTFSVVLKIIGANSSIIQKLAQVLKWLDGVILWPGMPKSQIGGSAMDSNVQAAGSARK